MDISVKIGNTVLKSPIIVGSSGLTKSVKNAQQYAEAGAGAIILKSLFEEQISMKCQSISETNDYTEAADYIDNYVRGQEITDYLDTIKKLKAEVSIPVFASISCTKNDSWIEFASNIEAAGADGIEINFMSVETDLFVDSSEVENKYITLIDRLRKKISIPIWVKVSPYHTVLPSFIDRLRSVGVDSVTLFNRGFQPDIDIDKEEVTSADIFTDNTDFYNTLRYTGLISSLVDNIAISSSTGIHSGKEVIKAILAGASSTQMCSSVYKNGADVISSSIGILKDWMKEHGYYKIEEFRGRLSYGKTESAVSYERTQFMKYFHNK